MFSYLMWQEEVSKPLLLLLCNYFISIIKSENNIIFSTFCLSFLGGRENSVLACRQISKHKNAFIQLKTCTSESTRNITNTWSKKNPQKNPELQWQVTLFLYSFPGGPSCFWVLSQQSFDVHPLHLVKYFPTVRSFPYTCTPFFSLHPLPWGFFPWEPSLFSLHYNSSISNKTCTLTVIFLFVFHN